MAGSSTTTGSRIGARLARPAAVGVIAAVGLVLAPGTAWAGPTYSVVPLLDCVRTNGDGTWTAVFGYENTTQSTVSIPVGPDNKVTPTTYAAAQPTTFSPGVHHGVFTVTVSGGGGPTWHLDRDDLAARESDGPVCPPTTQLPADGNGTGAAVALGAAGVVGAAVLYRFRRRLARLSDRPAPTDPGA